MMKHMKKFAAMLLAVVMVLGMAMSASAADENSIIINNTVKDYEYKAYQVFKGTVDDNQLVNITWGEGITDGDTLLAELKKNENFSACTTVVDVAHVLSEHSEKDSEVAKAFADIVASFLKADAAKTSVYSEEKYTITGLEDGFYFVKTTKVPNATESEAGGSYTRYILKVVGEDVEVNHKGTVPEVEKDIIEGEDTTDYTDVNIGDTVDFRLTGTLPDEYANYKSYKYIFHDVQSEGLTFNRDTVKVYVDDEEITTGFEIVTDELDDGCTFEVVFDDLKTIKSVNANSKIVIEYSSTLDADAVIGNDGNPNTVKLEFANDPNFAGDGSNAPTGETPIDKVIVFTYELDVTKKDGTLGNVLKDAEFVLYRGDGESIEYAVLDDQNKVSNWTSNKEEAEVLKSDANGKFVVIGLDAGTYYLKETNAPAGYNLLEEPIELKISAKTESGKVEELQIQVGQKTANGNNDTGIVETTVENYSGATLPETGGIGTTIFYIAGAALVLAAVVMLVTKRRMKAE